MITCYLLKAHGGSSCNGISLGKVAVQVMGSSLIICTWGLQYLYSRSLPGGFCEHADVLVRGVGQWQAE